MFSKEFSTILSKKDMHKAYIKLMTQRKKGVEAESFHLLNIIYICKETFLENFKYIDQLFLLLKNFLF
jgi:hypothetical protein